MTVLEPTVEQLKAEREKLRGEVAASEWMIAHHQAKHRQVSRRLRQIDYLLHEDNDGT